MKFVVLCRQAPCPVELIGNPKPDYGLNYVGSTSSSEAVVEKPATERVMPAGVLVYRVPALKPIIAAQVLYHTSHYCGRHGISYLVVNHAHAVL